MPTQILAIGTTEANSSDVTVAAGEELTVGIKGVASPHAGIVVQLKDDGGAYWPVDRLTPNRPALVLSAGTYRLSRVAGASCGAFSA